MNVFDGLIQIDTEGNIVYNKWIEWDHLLNPNKPNWLRLILRAIMAFFNLCRK